MADTICYKVYEFLISILNIHIETTININDSVLIIDNISPRHGATKNVTCSLECRLMA
jgi:hypothetical protein